MNRSIIVLLFCALGFTGCGTSTENPVIGIPSSTASITGKFLGTTPITIVGYNDRKIDTEITLSESGTQISGTAVYIEVNPPPSNSTYRAPARNLSGIRSGSQVTFTQVLSECSSGPISLTGTVQPNGDIRFAKGEKSVRCASGDVFYPFTFTFTFKEFTLVKQP
jgi:hypothetical protein